METRLSSRPALPTPRFTSPRLACQTPAFLRKCLLSLRSLFERKRPWWRWAFRCETLSTRYSADTSADRMFHKRTRSLSPLWIRDTRRIQSWLPLIVITQPSRLTRHRPAVAAVRRGMMDRSLREHGDENRSAASRSVSPLFSYRRVDGKRERKKIN